MLRLTPEQFADIHGRILAKQSRSAPRVKRHRNKYGAEPCEIDGRRFDSKAEGRRYLDLLDMERKGEITGLECQVSYELLPAQCVEGKKIRPCFYRCDFQYTNKNGVLVTEDVKSGPTKTAEYKIKAKMFAYRYGREIVEVMVTD